MKINKDIIILSPFVIVVNKYIERWQILDNVIFSGYKKYEKYSYCNPDLFKGITLIGTGATIKDPDLFKGITLIGTGATIKDPDLFKGITLIGTGTTIKDPDLFKEITLIGTGTTICIN